MFTKYKKMDIIIQIKNKNYKKEEYNYTLEREKKSKAVSFL